MKIFKIAIAILGISFLASCNGDFFDMVIDLEVKEHESKIAITAFIEKDNDSNSVLVSYSIGGLETTEDNQLINNATVSITGNGETTSFSLSEADGIYRADTPLNLSQNISYTLRVEAPNYETVTANQIMPNQVSIIGAFLENNKLKVRFQDAQNQENFYMIELRYYEEYTDSFMTDYIYPFGDSSNWSSTTNNVIFNDETFDGEETEITFQYDNNDSQSNPSYYTSYKVILYTITEDYYRYDRTLDLSYNAQDNPFTEPVILHRNIENGYGIFALTNASEFEFDVE